MKTLEEKIFFGLYNFGQKNKALYDIAMKITRLSERVFPASYLLILVYLIKTPKRLALAILIPLLVLIINILIRKSVKRTRPYIKYDLPIRNQRAHKDENNSFPSNHSASSLIIAALIFSVFKTAGIFLMAVSIITGLSRIIVGIHHPLDVAAGFAIATTAGFALNIIL